jgi:hypothetical protein
MTYNPGRLCWSNRVVADGDLIGSAYAISQWQGSSYRCGQDCAATANCVGYTFSYTNTYNGEGMCRLYSDIDTAGRAITTSTNLYMLDGNSCPPIHPTF